jgi:GWxTD domain-containing protein
MILRATQTADEATGTDAPTADVSGYLPMFFHVLPAQERAIFESLPDEASRELFYGQYWYGRDAERSEYEGRCDLAEHYATSFRDGWETDRGRVLIKFGQPDDIERMPIQVDTLPYEIWSYYQQGTETFVFVDRDGTGNFIQVYSTVEGEPSYSDWEQMLAPVGTPGSTEDS